MYLKKEINRPLITVATFISLFFVLGLTIGSLLPPHLDKNKLQYISTKYQEYDDNLVKRYLWWVIGAVVWKTLDLVFTWEGISENCRNFTESGWNAALCIYGVLSTIAVYSGAAYSTARNVGRLAQWANNNGVTILGAQWLASLAKRDLNWETRHENITVNINSTTHTFHDTGHHWNISNLYVNGSMYSGMAPSDRIPIFNVHGGAFKHHMGMVYVPERNHTLFKLGFGHITNIDDLSKRSDYDEQYFTEGGVDFAVDIQDENGAGVLSTLNDYGQMDHEVSCYMGSELDNNCFGWQIYDNNHDGTIGAGAAGPYSGADGEAYYAEDCYKAFINMLPIPESGNCLVS